MIQLMVAGSSSGSGKTMLSCALLCALRERGYRPCAFKCGPDYIDPMFHRGVPGVESRNLDLFLGGAGCVTDIYLRGITGHDAAVAEGVMGFYDGLGGTTDRASSWQVAETLGLPVLLSLPARGASLTLAAQLRGLREFRENSRITGVILNECSPALCRTLAPVLERESGIPVLGCLPVLDTARIESRHLGLRTAGELTDLPQRLARLAEALEQNADMERLLALFSRESPDAAKPKAAEPGVRIAVARDEAFCFLYTETLETLASCGAEPVFFSPLRDSRLPDGIGGLYLPGGYPELYTAALSGNEAMREAVRSAVRGGLPTVAECGGFLYLGQSLRGSDGAHRPMAGVLPGAASDAGRLTRFGYATLRAERDSLLFRAGERVPVHEFHRWDSTDNGSAFHMEKPLTGRTWRGGFAGDTLYAAFPHLYFAGYPAAAQRFVSAARRYEEKR